FLDFRPARPASWQPGQAGLSDSSTDFLLPDSAAAARARPAPTPSPASSSSVAAGVVISHLSTSAPAAQSSYVSFPVIPPVGGGGGGLSPVLLHGLPGPLGELFGARAVSASSASSSSAHSSSSARSSAAAPSSPASPASPPAPPAAATEPSPPAPLPLPSSPPPLHSPPTPPTIPTAEQSVAAVARRETRRAPSALAYGYEPPQPQPARVARRSQSVTTF
ncbi:hypothetical protein HK405_002379, partial [Cladochytrium tenue]